MKIQGSKKFISVWMNWFFILLFGWKECEGISLIGSRSLSRVEEKDDNQKNYYDPITVFVFICDECQISQFYENRLDNGSVSFN